MMQTVPIALENCAKTFADGTRALEAVNLEIAAGETVVLLGPSGCGKTTTLRLIAGLEQPDVGGRVRFGADDVTALPIEKRNVGMVFQSYALFPNMTVAENIAYGLRLRRQSTAEQRARVGEMLALMRIERLAERSIDQLSGGQRQRVALARALAVQPRVLLLDEPLTALDAKLRDVLRFEIDSLLRELGITAIYVTHDQAEAMALADRIVVMNEGRIEQVGSTREIYSECGSLFTAQFMGTPPANIQRVALASTRGRLVAAVKDAGAALDLGDQSAFPAIGRLTGGEVFLAVRPENIGIVEPNGINETSIEIVEPQGAYTILVVRVLGGEWKIMLEGDVDFRIGQKVSLKIDPAKVMLYDVQTTKRISLS